MNARDHDLLLLLRLRDGTLTPDEQAVLRERLLDEADLRRLWKQIAGTAVDDIAWDEVSAWEGAEDVAAAWDRQADFDQPTTDPDVWAADLRALDRAERDDTRSEIPLAVPSAVSERMAKEIQSQLGTEDAATPTNGASIPDSQLATTFEAVAESLARDHRGTVLGTSVPRRRRSRGVTAATVSAVLILGTIAAWSLSSSLHTRRPDDPNGTGTIAVSPSEPVPTPDGSAEPSIPPGKESPRSNGETRPLLSESPILADVAPSGIREPSSTAPDMPIPDRVVPTLRWLPLTWDRVQGLVVERETRDGEWSPIEEKASVPGNVAIWRSLGGSFATAAFAEEGRILLGPDSSVSLEFSSAPSPSIRVLQMSGRLGFQQLPTGVHLRLVGNKGTLDWEVSEEDTRVGIVTSADTATVYVLAGGLTRDGEAISSPQAIVIDASATPRLERGPKSLAWLDRTPAPPTYERELVRSLDGRGDLVASLLTVQPAWNDVERLTAATWGIALDPVRAIPPAAASSRGEQRAAAISWLASAERTTDELVPVMASLRTSFSGSTLSVPRWYAAARGELPVTAALIQELAQGVAPSEPLFVRHTAIEFLRRITGQAFAAYDPVSPSRAALAEVRAAARLWVPRLQ